MGSKPKGEESGHGGRAKKELTHMPFSPALQELPSDLISLSADEKRQAITQSAFLKKVHRKLDLEKFFSGYPWLLLLAVTIMERVDGSQRALLIELRKGSCWKDVCREYRILVNDPALDLPPVPPAAHVMDRFLKWITSEPKVMRKLHRIQLTSAVAVAEYCGQFPSDPSQMPDNLVNVDRRFIIHGDGTFIPPYSQVTEHVDTTTGEITLLGSRATSYTSARIQRSHTDGRADGKHGRRGINHVVISTYTDFGPIIFSVGQAAKSEVRQAEEQIQLLHEHLGDRLVWLVWDRAVTGKVIGNLLSAYGLITVNKNVQEPEERAAKKSMSIDADEAKRLFQQGQPLPLGTSVYPTSKGYEVVKSYHLKFRTHREGECCHEIHEDDGALYVVGTLTVRDQQGAVEEPPEGHLFDASDQRLFKIVRVSAQWAERRRTSGSLQPSTKQPSWQLHTNWSFQCPDHPDVTHQFETLWDPSKTEAGPRERGKGSDPFNRIRVLPRDDPRFAPTHGRRNVTESVNNTIKRTLGTGKERGRAIRLDPHIQSFQVLCAALRITAITERTCKKARALSDLLERGGASAA